MQESSSLDLYYEADRILRFKASSEFLYFVNYMEPGYQSKWYHKYVCSIFDQLLNTELSRLMIFMPPQHGKSTMMTVNLPAYVLGRNPNTKIILSTYNQTLAASFNREIQRVIVDEKYAKIFPSTKLNDKNVVTDATGNYVRNSEKFEVIGCKGSLKSVGVGGGIAGHPADMALLDDVIKSVDEAYSVTYRNRLYDWYTDELESRLHNDSKVAFTITRRHEDDLAGRLIERDGKIEEGGKWKVISFPALKEDNSDVNDPRDIGEALWPERHSKERLEDIRKNSPRTFASLYQQRPAPTEGGIIKKEWFRIVDYADIPKNMKWNFYLDTAYTSNEQNDPTAILTCAWNKGELFIRDVQEKWADIVDLWKFIPEYVKENGYDRRSIIKVEPKASGKDIVAIIRKNTSLNVAEHENPTKDKTARLMDVASIIESKRVCLIKGSWNNKFIAQVSTFPNAKHDDMTDTLVMALRDSEDFKTKRSFTMSGSSRDPFRP